jgi:hypothetical protein
MRDVREEILVRLLEVLLSSEAVPLAMAHRNRSDLETMERPCAILLDGAESITGSLQRASGRGPDIRVDLVEMRPQIFLFLQARKESEASERGPELNMYRLGIMNAVRNDGALIELVGSNGGIFYRGCDTDMQTGEAVQGMMLFHFAFQYVLDPRDLS